MPIISRLTALILSLLIALPTLRAAEPDSTYHYRPTWQSFVLPAALITAGAAAVPSGWLHNKVFNASDQIRALRSGGPRIVQDDYLQYFPLTASVALGCAGIPAKHNLRDRVLILATSYAALGILTQGPKHLINEKRPEFNAYNSFPSGHTATAFMGAELVRMEYGPWWGTGAYAIASGVGFMRVYNGWHWLNDVVAGAGVGILSARLGQWSTHLWSKWLDKQPLNATLTPIITPRHTGLTLAAVF